MELISEESSLSNTALVTGAGGFAGRHLVDLLLAETAWTVAGISRSGTGISGPGASRFHDFQGDIANPEDIGKLLEQVRPDYVFHLAAATPPAAEFEFLRTSVLGTALLFDKMLELVPDAQVLVVGSDAQYGRQEPSSLPTREDALLRPVNAYGRAKLLQERVATAYGAASELRVVCVRPFNHIGPGQSPRFVIASLSAQIARAEAGGSPVVELGSEMDRRDFTDVRDVVRAYLQALIMGLAGGIYNIGSGVSHSIAEAAGILQELARTEVRFKPVADRVRRGELTETLCDASRLRSLTGWSPAIPFETSLRDTLDYFREVTARTGITPGGGAR